MKFLKLDIKIFVIAAVFSLSCTTKVSEWILLNSEAEKYVLVYYHSQPVQESLKMKHAELEKLSETANLIFKTLKNESVDKPVYRLFYGNRLISEYSGFDELSGIVNSALREKVSDELMAGKLCVMLYLKTGNEQKDAAGLEILNKTVKSSVFGDIITVMDLDRNSTEEKHFVNLLLNIEDDLMEINEPMLFGVFGRLRVLEPLLAKGISEDNINYMIDFLTADCSCLIKDDLPGVSILCDFSWEDPEPALVNTILDENPFLQHKYASP